MEIVTALPDNFDTIQGIPVMRHRESIVPIITIDGRCRHDFKTFVIFIGIGNMRAGLMATSIIGEEELVIKALDDRAASGIAAGASILGNGSVVLILDPLSLIKRGTYQNGSVSGLRSLRGMSAG